MREKKNFRSTSGYTVLCHPIIIPMLLLATANWNIKEKVRSVSGVVLSPSRDWFSKVFDLDSLKRTVLSLLCL